MFARGLLDRLFTRAYLPGHPHDRLLASLADERRATLVAEADDHGFVFDIRLQGDGGDGVPLLPGHARLTPMTNLLWPGDERAGDLFSDESFLAAMVAVEEAWLDALAGSGIAPASVAKLDLQRLVGAQHLPVARGASRSAAATRPPPSSTCCAPGWPTSAPTGRAGCIEA